MATKNQIYFDPATGWFFSREDHGTNIPATAVPITAARHAALVEGLRIGKRIVMKTPTVPELADPLPPVTPDA